MMILLLGAATVLVFTSTTADKPVSFNSLGVSYTSAKQLTINAGDSQVFRAPLCGGEYVNARVMKVKVYVQNVAWSSHSSGEDTWLEIRVSNSADMTTIVADNMAQSADPQSFTEPFAYNKDTWGSDDVYIEITARVGSSTYAYALELAVEEADPDQNVRDGMDSAVQAKTRTVCEADGIEDLQQLSIPHNGHLPTPGSSAQYTIPFCFEDISDKEQKVAVFSVVSEKDPGGISAYVCTTPMMSDQQQCHTSAVTGIMGTSNPTFWDDAGVKVAFVNPTIPKEAYTGPVYLLVVSEGTYEESINFTVAARLSIEYKDRNTRCAEWANSGECDANPGYMLESCKKSCKRVNKDAGLLGENAKSTCIKKEFDEQLKVEL